MAVNTKAIIGAYCEATGRKMLSRNEWQRCGHQVRLWMQKGYTEEDILNAIEYAKNHVKNFYGFGLIGCVIDKAKDESKPNKQIYKPQPQQHQKSLLDEYNSRGVVLDKAIPYTTKPSWMRTDMEVV